MSLLEELIHWFLDSSIYSGKAYHAYYSAGVKGPIYPEITAYAISLCCILGTRVSKDDKRYIDRAEECSDYIMNLNKKGAVPGLSDSILYAFDTGIFISGILDLYLMTRKDVYLKEAKKSLNWLFSLWDGESFSAVDRTPEIREWYHVPSVHLAKLALPLLKASICLKEERYKKTALQLLDKYKDLQTKNGGFRLGENSCIVMTHPHCYATEGFLYAYTVLKRQEFLEVARKSSEWLRRKQNMDGSLYRSYYTEETEDYSLNPKEKLKTSDATAQAIRIWKLLGVNQKEIGKACGYLKGELKDGGLRLFKAESFRGKLFSWRRAVYSWPTFFYLHSLSLPFGQMQYCRELF